MNPTTFQAQISGDYMVIRNPEGSGMLMALTDADGNEWCGLMPGSWIKVGQHAQWNEYALPAKTGFWRRLWNWLRRP